MAAYEALWSEAGSSFKKIADKFRTAPDAIPSDLVPEAKIEEFAKLLQIVLAKHDVKKFGVRVHGAGEYPEKLRDAKHPIELLYYQGWWELINTPSIAVVGARKVSEEGARRTRKIVKFLVDDGYTIVSGLADGVDTAAHRAALEFNGKTIAVIGTPLSHAYPKNNLELQNKIRDEHLIISQVPFSAYIDSHYKVTRSFFPARNITMSALTQATVIIEASDTSGTLYQARAAINQGRKLFILDSCFQNKDITWPEKYEKKGAIRVKDYSDIKSHLTDV
jgi:DNA processing protein